MVDEPNGRSESVRAQLAALLRDHDRLMQRLQGDQAHFRRIARAVWRVQEDERGRFARELHDGVGHNLAAIAHLIKTSLAALPADASLEGARSGLLRAREVAESTLQDARTLSRMLRPQILDDLGLEAALRWLTRSCSETHALDVRLHHADAGSVGGDRATLVFRIVQEALANAVRHSGATRVDVDFTCAGGEAELRVRDNGRGCTREAAFARGSEGASSGLGGMRDRARLFNGSLDVDTSPEGGFALVVRFPLHDPPEPAR
jgi:signal transduction histidine kinase